MPTITSTGAAVRPYPSASSSATGAAGTRPIAPRVPTPPAQQEPTLPGRRYPDDDQARSARYDAIATELEQRGRPTRDQFRTSNGVELEWEYREAVANYDQQLEEAQQAAKPERLRRLRAELQQTAVGRELLEFERRAGVPLRVRTDAEWRRDGTDPGVLAYSSGDEGLTFNVRNLNAHVYVHEMTHQVDHRTHLLAPAGDTRSRDQVVAEASDLYRRYGLDPAEVPAVVDATYGQPDQGAALSHAHTRLTEARQQRLELGGSPLTEPELREVLEQSRPREQDIAAVAAWEDSHDDAALRTYAAGSGIPVDGVEPAAIVEALRGRIEARERRIAAVETRGTRAPEQKAPGNSKAGDAHAVGEAVAHLLRAMQSGGR